MRRARSPKGPILVALVPSLGTGGGAEADVPPGVPAVGDVPPVAPEAFAGLMVEVFILIPGGGAPMLGW